MTTITPVRAAASTWNIDPAHSSVEFSVKHMMISTVRGRFRGVKGSIVIDEERQSEAVITAAIDVASVDTGVEQRDAHLRSDDFFNAERYPEITFRSTRIERDGERWRMTGDLTLRDVTRSVVLDVEYDGQVTDANSKQRAGFTARTAINRHDFGVSWNGLIEAGGVAVSDKVKITINVAVVRAD